YVLLAIGLNIVVGFAGLLDLGYAAFFAIGAYTYGMLASGQLFGSPLHHEIHLPFWLLLFVGMFVAAGFGAILGAPTLRLRCDYLAIVTLGFREIVVIVGVVAATNLHRPRLGRAWMAVREDEVAAAATGVNTVAIKLLAFSIGASFAGLAGCYYGAKLSLVSSENFEFIVSVSILIMVVLGGMGNIPGVIVGALTIYIVQFFVLTNLPDYAVALSNLVGLGFLNQSGPGWVGLHDEVQRLNYIVFGLILVVVMLLRPQGLFPSRIREQELE